MSLRALGSIHILNNLLDNCIQLVALYFEGCKILATSSRSLTNLVRLANPGGHISYTWKRVACWAGQQRSDTILFTGEVANGPDLNFRSSATARVGRNM